MAEVTLEESSRKVRDLYQKAYGAMERGNLDYAMDMFEQVLELEPGLLQARRCLRAAALKKFKDKKVGQFAQSMASITGMGTMMKLNGALKKDPVKAVAYGEKLLRMAPLHLPFVRTFAQAALAAEMPEVAIQALEIAKEHNPADYDLIKWLGQLYLDANETHKGRQCFEILVQLRPNDQEAIKNLKDAAALDTMNKGGWTGAKSYRDAMKDKKEAALLEQQAKAVKTGRGAEDLIADTLRKIEREPDNINYRRALAELYAKAERFEEALQALGEAQQRSGGDPQLERAISQVRVHEYDARIRELRSAGDEAGAEALEAEKDAYVLQDATERVNLYPNDLGFKFELGQLLYQHQQYTEAIQQLQLAQRNPARRLEALYYLGLCFKAKNQLDIAAEQLEKANSEYTTMNATKKDIMYELGLIYEAMGRKDQALKQFKEIYSVDISYRDVADRIEKGYAG